MAAKWRCRSDWLICREDPSVRRCSRDCTRSRATMSSTHVRPAHHGTDSPGCSAAFRCGFRGAPASVPTRRVVGGPTNHEAESRWLPRSGSGGRWTDRSRGRAWLAGSMECRCALDPATRRASRSIYRPIGHRTSSRVPGRVADGRDRSVLRPAEHQGDKVAVKAMGPGCTDDTIEDATNKHRTSRRRSSPTNPPRHGSGHPAGA